LILTIARKFSRKEVDSELEAKLDVKLQATLGSTDNFHAVAMAAFGFGNDASAARDTKNNDATGVVMTRTKAMAAAANRLECSQHRCVAQRKHRYRNVDLQIARPLHNV
jgi:hypothetical protein